jgi:hypothetical protein
VDRDGQGSWREHRRRAAAFHAESLDRRREAEAADARRLITAFVATARERGIAPEQLVARSYSNGATYSTKLRGWYIRSDRTLAVGDDGQYYVLTVPGGWRTRLTGASVAPSQPPLVVGVGARDGESRALADLLRDRLEQARP